MKKEINQSINKTVSEGAKCLKKIKHSNVIERDSGIERDSDTALCWLASREGLLEQVAFGPRPK